MKKQIVPNHEAYMHLLKLYRCLASGVLLDAAEDFLKGEIHQLERDLGLQPGVAV